MVIRIRQPRLRGRLVPEVGIFVPITLHERAVIQVFEPAATIGHRRLKYLRADC